MNELPKADECPSAEDILYRALCKGSVNHKDVQTLIELMPTAWKKAKERWEAQKAGEGGGK